MKILLLEDDIILSEIIEEFLNEKEYEVICCDNGEEAQDIIYREVFDLLLLDINVPFVNGFEILKDLREKDIKTPAIYITSLNTSKDLKYGFKMGADDYIKKPFELDELDARIDNIKRLYNIKDERVKEIGDKILFDIKNNILKIDDKEINLTKKEALILEYLINNANSPISIDELTLNIWGYENTPSSATIRTYIKNLRKYLGKDLISNIKGVGYRINIL